MRRSPLVLLILILFYATNVLASGMGVGSGTGDMTAADYASGGKITPTAGGTGADTSGITGWPYILSGAWQFDNLTVMLSRIGLGADNAVTFSTVTASEFISNAADNTRGSLIGNTGDVTAGYLQSGLVWFNKTTNLAKIRNGDNTATLIYYPTGTMTDTKYCIYTAGTGFVCNSEGGSMTYPGAGLAVSTGSAWGTSLSSTAPTFTDNVTIGSGAYGTASLSREWYYGHLILRNKSGTGPSSLSFVPATAGGGSGIVAYHDPVTTSGTGRRFSFETYYTLEATRGPLMRIVSESDGAAVFPVSIGLTPNNATPANYTHSIYVDNGAMVGGSVGAFGDVVVNDNQALWVKTQTASTNSGKAASTAYVDNAISTRGGYTLQFLGGFAATTTDAQTLYVGNTSSAPGTTAYVSNIYVPVTGTINVVNFQIYCGTAGSNENWTASLRKNNTTDYAIQTIGSTDNLRNFVNTSLAAGIIAGDYLQVKLVNPTWATTNPANCSFSGVAYVSP